MSPKRRLRLLRQLRATRDSLSAWEDSLRSLSQESAEPFSRDAVALLRLLQETKAHLDARLRELGEGEQAALAAAIAPRRAAPPARVSKRSPGGICVRACRGCGKALGKAFREAQAVADAASARVLYVSLRAIEKQLWLIDPRHAG